MSKKTAFSIVGLFFVSVVAAWSLPHFKYTEQSQLAAVAPAMQQIQLTELSVDEQKVSNEVRRLTAQLYTTPAPTAGQTDLRISLARQRMQYMEKLAVLDPTAFRLQAISPAIRAKFPSAVRAYIERQAKLAGTIHVRHVDDFKKPKNSHFEYYLDRNGKRLPLYLSGSVPAMTSGSTVEVNGYQVNQTLVAAADAGGITVTTVAEPTPDSLGEQKTLVILLTDPGQLATLTKEEMHDIIFNGNFGQFYKEQSYGKTWFTGDVTEWITLGTTPSFQCGAADLTTPEVASYLLGHSIDLSRYDRILYVVHPAAVGCADVGKTNYIFNGSTYYLSQAWVGYAESDDVTNQPLTPHWINTTAHEIGHALGLPHANAWHCSGPSLDENCSHVEYGNTYDVMGSAVDSAHNNALYKDYLGWFDAADKIEIRESGTYTLAPLESATGRRVAIITNPALLAANPDAQPLYIEYRQPLGFDRNLPTAGTGLHLNQFANESSHIISANYMTAAPVPNMGAYNFPLLTGSAFSWLSQGLSVSLSSATPEAATFTVSLSQPNCARVMPTLDFMLATATLAPGVNAGIVTVTNNDSSSCSDRSFQLGVSVTDASGWDITVTPSNAVSMGAGERRPFGQIMFAVPNSATVGSHTMTLTLTDSVTGTAYSYQKNVTVSSGGPEAPSNFDVSCSMGTYASMRWDDVFGATSYQPWVNVGAGLCPSPWTLHTDAASGHNWCYYNNYSGAHSALGTSATSLIFPTTPGASYTFWVNAVNAAGRGNPSSSKTVACALPKLPVPPANFDASCTAGTYASMRWDDVPGATSYQLWADVGTASCPTNAGWNLHTDMTSGRNWCYFDNYTGPHASLGTNATSATFPTTPGNSYTLWLGAVNSAGRGNPSVSKTVTCAATTNAQSSAVAASPPAITYAPDGTSIVPGDGKSLITKDGTWTFGTTTNAGGTVILRNNTARGSGDLLLVAQGGLTFAHNKLNVWYKWDSATSKWLKYTAGDPRTTAQAKPQSQFAAVLNGIGNLFWRLWDATF